MTAQEAKPQSEGRSGADTGIVRIFSSHGDHCGMGILLTARLILTCAHVVNLAAGLNALNIDGPGPEERINVGFPMSGTIDVFEASLAHFAPPDPMGRKAVSDMALLHLTADAPADVGRAILADVKDLTRTDRSLKSFGFPGHDVAGRWASSRVLERSNPAWVQIGGAAEDGVTIEPGFSGAAVYSEADDAVIGMVVARLNAPGATVAFMIPASSMIDFAGDIPFERRTLGHEFSRQWSLAFISIFVVMLLHMMADRIGEFPPWLSLGFGNKQLACFYGMQIGAVLLPFLLYNLRRFAVSRQEHRWWERVPRLSLRRAGFAAASASSASGLGVLLMICAMLYMQGHFIKRFFVEGHVYVYGGDFGYTRSQLLSLAPSAHCEDGTGTLCTHPDAGRFSVLSPINSARGGYWNNHYHYGDLTVGRYSRSQTFFPILQPLLVLLLTALATTLAILAGRTVFRQSAGARQ